MCIAFNGLQQMTIAGGGGQIADIPEVQTQMRILRTFGTQLQIPAVTSAVYGTLAAVQSNGSMDPVSNRILGKFCAGVGN